MRELLVKEQHVIIDERLLVWWILLLLHAILWVLIIRIV